MSTAESEFGHEKRESQVVARETVWEACAGKDFPAPAPHDVSRQANQAGIPAEGEAEARPLPGHSDRRRDQILTGAAQMFAEHGYHGASLRNIAHHVGISHPGMLHHFPSKDALHNAVIDQLEAHAQTALDRIEELAADPEAFLRGLTEIWHPGTHSIQLLAMLDAEAVSKNYPGRFRMARLHRVHEHVLEQCFTAFEERGLLREGIDAPFAARALFALVLSHAIREETVRTMQSDPHDDDPHKDLAKLARAFFAQFGQ